MQIIELAATRRDSGLGGSDCHVCGGSGVDKFITEFIAEYGSKVAMKV